MSSIEKVIAAAQAEVGVREVPLGSNWGPRVSQYIREGGYDAPVFWCMCFCTAMLRWTLKLQARPWPRTGSCDVILSWARRQGILHDQPAVGDIFLVMAGPNDAVHTGIVTGLPGGGRVATIEGNTNDDGSSNGIGVFARSRRIAGLKFVRWIDVMPDALAEPDIPNAKAWVAKIGDKSIELSVDGAGRTIGPARAILEALEAIGKVQGVQAKLGFDSENHTLTWDGEPVPAMVTLMDGKSLVSVRDLANFVHAEISIAGKVITVA